MPSTHDVFQARKCNGSTVNMKLPLPRSTVGEHHSVPNETPSKIQQTSIGESEFLPKERGVFVAPFLSFHLTVAGFPGILRRVEFIYSTISVPKPFYIFSAYQSASVLRMDSKK